MFFCAYTLYAQEEYNVFKEPKDNLLSASMAQRLQYVDLSRKSDFNKAVTSLSHMDRYVMAAKVRYVSLLNFPSSKVPMAIRFAGEIKQDKYSIEKIIYESVPGYHVAANIYVPNSKGKHPAVLFICGGDNKAKAADDYQRAAQLLVRNGFVVMIIDPVSKGERGQLATSYSSKRTSSQEHTLLDAGSILMGRSLVDYELWDHIRGLDYLESRYEVDVTRIACVGNAIGAARAVNLAAIDERIKVLVAGSFLSMKNQWIVNSGASDASFHLPFEGRELLDIPDLVAMYAPKPALFMAGTNDFVDTEGAAMAYEEVRKAYAANGALEKVKWYGNKEKAETFGKAKREEMLRFLKTHFYNDNTPVEEQEMPLLRAQDLQCSRSGSIMKSFPEELSIPEQNIAIALRYEEQRASFATNDKATCQLMVNDLLGGDYNRKLTKILTEDVPKGPYTMTKLILEAEGQPALPCLFLQPKVSKKEAVVLYVNDQGKHTVFEDEAAMNALSSGMAVLAIDLRGTGETKDWSDRNEDKYLNEEYRNPMLALHIGSPLMGQRVSDVLMALDFLHKNYSKTYTVKAMAHGMAYPVVLHAALFDESITGIDAKIEVRSWMQLLTMPTTKNQFSYVVPSVLKYYDWPDLERFLEKEKVKINVEIIKGE